METEIVKSILETEEESQSCNGNKKLASSNAQIPEFKEMTTNETK